MRRPELSLASRRGTPPALPSNMEIALQVCFRLCRPDDLSRLEWHGLFTEHRHIIRNAFRRQQQGNNLMLLAEANGEIVGQVWLDLTKHLRRNAAWIWALRVVPWLQRLGLGTQLIHGAEELARQRGFTLIELGVETDNGCALLLYQRLGFKKAGTFEDSFEYTRPAGEKIRVVMQEFLMRKRL